MAKQKDFDAFLSNIEPSSSTVAYICSVQNNLRDYLAKHSIYKDIHKQTFLSGSYAKHTSIRPKLYDRKRDVDIVVVTTYDTSSDSTNVLQELYDTLKEKETYANTLIQSHSVQIELEGICIDVVPVACCNYGDKFYIGSSERNVWVLTDPQGHITWSSDVNSKNNLKYKPAVKMLKWWRRTNCPEEQKYPKGIALEKMIADNLPDSGLCAEEYLIKTMYNIAGAYKTIVDRGIKPSVYDPCISDNDLLAKYQLSDIKSFIDKISEHLEILNQNGTSNESWRKIFGNEFPKKSSETETTTNRFSYDDTEENIEKICPVRLGYELIIDCTVTQDGWRPFSLRAFLRTGGFLRHNEKLDFYIKKCNVPSPYSIYWKVRNIGEVAERRNCIRGEIKMTDKAHHIEHTNFYGPHYVECYIVKNGVCVARNRIEVPIGDIA